VLREGLLTYNLDTGALERYDGSAWVPAAPETPGIGSNVVQTVKTDTFSSTTSTFTTITGLSATITPTSTSSKILIIAQVVFTTAIDVVGTTQIRIDGGNATDYVGDAAGSRIRSAAGLHNADNIGNSGFSTPIVYLDSPNTTSATTYSVQVRQNGGTFYVNRSRTDTNNALFGRYASSITAIEVAA
jgi:hypothetical protein